MSRSIPVTRPAGLVVLAIAASLLAAPAVHALSFAEEAGSPIAVGANPIPIAAGDLNGDGGPDLAVANGTSATVNVLLRQVTGGFAQEGAPINVAGGPSDAVIADFNGDFRNDIAVSGFAGSSVTILLRDASNTGFTPEAAIPVSNPGALGAGDFDGDGKVDLAVTLYNNLEVAAYLRNVTNTGFAFEGTTGTGTNPRSIAVADFNADTRPDLAVTNVSSGNVSILLRQPGGGFADEAGSPIAVGASPQTIRSADFDGDGRPDLAFPSSGAATATVLLRDPSSGFTLDAGSPFTVGSAPVGTAAGDFDNDGRPDLVVAQQGAGNVGVFRREAAGGFTQDPAAPIATGSAATSLAIADFDSDGRRDFAVTNQGANNVSVLLNTTLAPDLGSAPPPPPGVAPSPVTGELPPPSTGRSVNADPVSGTVLVKVPGSKRFVALGDEKRQIPVKSIVDTRKGRVEIETAAGTAVKATQRAVFYDGVFQLLQERVKKDAIVEARLVGALENCTKASKGAVSAATRRGRRLWGKGRGRFRTRGKRSSTTVRGTTWLVEDRCDGSTVTTVKEGTVEVQAGKKKITVKAPGSYVARP